MKPFALLIACCAAALSACGGSAPTEPAAPADTAPAKRSPKREPRPRRAHCPPAMANCRTARGTIIYIEAKDPDGDGDAHFVLAGGDSITSAGISVIDVKRSLRPKPLPRPGDAVAAAGPVYRGSYGQRQIEAIELYLARR